MLNLSTLLEDSARTHPDRTAVVAGSDRLSFASVERTANQVANLLVGRGIRPGDTVALSCPNLPWFPSIYYGIVKTGAAVVPLNILLSAPEVAYHLRDSGARAFFAFEGTPGLRLGDICTAGFADAPDCELLFLITADSTSRPGTDSLGNGVEPLAPALAKQPEDFDAAITQASDTAVVLYTSGTTGRPKGAELTHANVVLNALTAHRILEGREAVDTHLVALPLFHAFGQVLQMHTAFAGGNTLVLMPRFEPNEAVRLMLEESVTHFAAVPTMYHGLLSALPAPEQTAQIARNMRLGLSGGAAMPVDVIGRIKEAFDVDVREGYGLSETSPGACFTPVDGLAKPGSIGKPIWSVQMKLVDDAGTDLPDRPDVVGEIAVKGHVVMKGYRNRPEATAEVLSDGWFRTGDLARKDEDGYYFIVDRSKDLIIRGGYNVYPREVEEVLMGHPAISLAAVVGVPHESLGEEVKAYVLKEPGDPTSEDELIAWVKTRIAAYKYPRLLEFVTSFPMTATGKILKREL